MEGPNPYAAPAADFLASAPVNEHEATRRRLIGTETNIRSLGSLMMFGAVLSGLSALGSFKTAAVDGIITLVIAGVALFAGLALRKLDTIGRTLYTVIAVISMVRSAWAMSMLSSQPGQPNLVPVLLLQLVFVALFLALLWGKNAREIFTDHYRRVVIPATPYVKYKTSVVAIVILVILVIGLVSAIAAAVFAS